ncbi:DUF2528 family protein (plasmid) [Pseudomonas sp. B26140]|uniref:DUF2528 family protein n=1 Tax=Pseudomonas sp. B26140 TaxID=3235112 RepID=UPI0037836AF0
MTIKRYTVTESWKDYSVTLEVDHSILTPDRATELNSFWSGAQDFADAEDGDVVRAVIRLAGSTLIRIMLTQGGTDFTEKTKGIFNMSPGPIWTKDLHDEEGWGGSEPDAPFGWCGIRCVAASVETPGFDDMELKEVAQA